MLLPLGAALLVLAAALAGYVMVKFFGVIFLGLPREQSLARAHEAGRIERIGLAWLALGCVASGLFPGQIIPALNAVTRQLGLAGIADSSAQWWLLTPLPERSVSYAPTIFFAVIVAIVVLTIAGVRLFYHQRIRRDSAWDCGFGRLDSRMQDTAEGFGQPIRHLFEPFFAITRHLPGPFDAAPAYRLQIGDRIWRGIYEPLAALVRNTADLVARLQQGRIANYLLYSFFTLVVLLAVML
jgi:hypothetical protein